MRKTVCPIFQLPKGGIHTTKIDDTYKTSAQYANGCRRKVRKNVYFKYSKLQKGHDSYKNCPNLKTYKLDLKFIK